MTGLKHCIQERAKVAKVTPVGRTLFWLALESPRLVEEAKPQPGQFLHVLAGRGEEPLLRRPLSVLDVDENRSQVELYVQVVGKGSRLISSLSPGAELDLLGPLGNPFRSVSPEKTLFLVAGGVGLAPLYFLARSMAPASSTGRPDGVELLLGARTHADIPSPVLLDRLPQPPLLATDDGSWGNRGTVIDLLEEVLSRLDRKRAEEVELAGCGPAAMLAALADLARRRRLPCQVSLEQVMACGVGACQGCVVEAELTERESGAGERYARVCTEGPVFEAEEINWPALLRVVSRAGPGTEVGK